MGVVPSSYPVNLIHLFTSGPQEAIIQVALKPGAARAKRFGRDCARACTRNCRMRKISFEAADIVSQVMSFGSPTPIEVAVQGVKSAGRLCCTRRKFAAQMAKLPFLRDLQFAQEMNYPTLDITIDRERAGQFGLTMADVVRSVVPATSSSRFTQPNYWRDPNSGQCVSDSGAAAAESDAERGLMATSAGDARGRRGDAAQRHRQTERREPCRG